MKTTGLAATKRGQHGATWLHPKLGLDAPEFSGTYRTERGNEYECFNLPKRKSEEK